MAYSGKPPRQPPLPQAKTAAEGKSLRLFWPQGRAGERGLTMGLARRRAVGSPVRSASMSEGRGRAADPLKVGESDIKQQRSEAVSA